MDAIDVETGPFTEIIERYLMKFREDVDGKCRQPPKILVCQLVGMQMVRSLQANILAINNRKAKFKTHGYVEE